MSNDFCKDKQAKADLQTYERKLSNIIEFLPDAILAIDDKKRVIIWNKAIEKMTGIPATEMLGKDDYAYSIPFCGEAQPQLMDLIFQNDDLITSKYSELTHEGDVIKAEIFCPALYNNKGAWVYTMAIPIYDQFGNTIGAIESIQDISEHLLMMNDLQSQTMFLEAQANASLDGILIVNMDQKRILANQRIFEMFNVPQHIIDDADDTLLLRHVVSMARDQEHFLKKVSYLYDHQNETSLDEIEFTNELIIERHSAPVLDENGKYYGRIWIFHEITEHKRLERALLNEKNSLATTLQSVGDGVISTDNHGNIVILNKIGEYLTGWTQEEAMGKPIEDVFNVVNGYTGEKSDNIVNKALSMGRIIELANHVILISKDGNQRSIEDCASPIIEENGKISGVVVVFRDVSEERIRKEELLYASYHDFLTGLYNRRFYEEELKRLDIKRNLPLTLLMADINGLKLINDALGYAKGDDVIKKVGRKIIEGCRGRDDVIARLGGDEFIIILPKTDAVGAERIIKQIKDHESEEKVGVFEISITFGQATKNNEIESIQDIFKQAENNLYLHKLYQNFGTISKTVDLVMRTLYEKNNREMLHSKRVSEICEAIALQMGFETEMVNQIRLAGLVHDIGKIGIDEKILNKHGKLNQVEWKEIQRHPEIGYRILNSSTEFMELATYVLQHQEKWDGQGYPLGLKGDNISIQARIIGIADAYDAMTSYRTYGDALSEEDAIKEIKRCSGSQFNPEIARIFVEKVMGKVW
ncbi:HD domain-containing phosphohydrolase [Acetobacterium tundrae]|uniref:Diguanylate cyclase n=1 Tax=Acetobacterium tundrae TaxID=132932 RepID=A0ABR6WNJ0_9FIRM|nr:HD domain-containing phosphohydrolase [Acetobacterium tundrae]MBC3797697.1 diguanylate cyclase [Acetobacterium tundrae]